MRLGIYVVLLRMLYKKFPNIAYLHLIRPKPDRLLEQMLAAMDIIMGGVMERFPKLCRPS